MHGVGLKETRCMQDWRKPDACRTGGNHALCMTGGNRMHGYRAEGNQMHGVGLTETRCMVKDWRKPDAQYRTEGNQMHGVGLKETRRTVQDWRKPDAWYRTGGNQMHCAGLKETRCMVQDQRKPDSLGLVETRHRVGSQMLLDLKVHKRENFLGFDFEICTFLQLVMHKCKGFV